MMEFFIKVDEIEDIGKNEKERVLITEKVPLKADSFEEWGKFRCTIRGDYVHPATPKKNECSESTESDKYNKLLALANVQYETNIYLKNSVDQLINRIKSLENKFDAGSEYDKLVHSGLSKEIAELEQTFESECNHYDNEIKQLKHAMCKQANIPHGEEMTAAEHIEPYQFVYIDSNGKIRPCTNPKQIPNVQIAGISINNKSEHDMWVEKQKNVGIDPLPPKEPDIIEQIKAGEKRLIHLYKHANSLYNTGEIRTLKEHMLQLINLEYNIELDAVVVSVLYKIYYMNRKKGIRFEFI